MLNYRKSFTLVEMLVALAVSSIIIIASYASYDLVATQYRKNLDVADMHTSGRAIMRIIERDIRMAGFEYRDKDAKVTYGAITLPPDEQSKLPVPSAPLDIDDSGNKCCDKVRVIYDYFDEESKKSERIRIRYWTEHHKSNKGSRYRLYKQKDILGQNKKILAKPILGTKDVMADYIEDFQIVNIENNGLLYSGRQGGNNIGIFDTKTRKSIATITNTGRIDALAFGPDGLLYSARQGGNNIVIFDTKTRKSIAGIPNTGRIDALAFKNKRTGQESLVTINLTLRTKNQYGKDRQYKKKDYHTGNYKLDKTDKYKRDTFSSTVLVRNLAL